MRKRLGFVLLGIVFFCWVAVPILPFFDFPYKLVVITSLLIGGEILFVITIALLGKEYWGRIKRYFRRIFSFKRKSSEEPDDEAAEEGDAEDTSSDLDQTKSPDYS